MRSHRICHTVGPASKKWRRVAGLITIGLTGSALTLTIIPSAAAAPHQNWYQAEADITPGHAVSAPGVSPVTSLTGNLDLVIMSRSESESSSLQNTWSVIHMP